MCGQISEDISTKNRHIYMYIPPPSREMLLKENASWKLLIIASRLEFYITQCTVRNKKYDNKASYHELLNDLSLARNINTINRHAN